MVDSSGLVARLDGRFNCELSAKLTGPLIQPERGSAKRTRRNNMTGYQFSRGSARRICAVDDAGQADVTEAGRKDK